MNLLWFCFSCLTIGVPVARFVHLGTHQHGFLMEVGTRASYFRERTRGLEPTLVQIALRLAAAASNGI